MTINCYDPLHVCPVCGKNFICRVPDEWAYRAIFDTKHGQDKKLVCSWHCLRQREREREAEKERRANMRKERKKK